MDILPHLINDLKLYKNRYHRKEMQVGKVCVCVREREREMEREGGTVGWVGGRREDTQKGQREGETEVEREVEEGSGRKRKKQKETDRDRQGEQKGQSRQRNTRAGV